MKHIGNLVKEYSVFLVLIALVIVMSVLSFDAFMSTNNIFIVLRQISITGIVSVGLVIVMLTGGLDLSVGSMVAFTCVMSAVFIVKMDVPPLVAGLLVTAIGAAIGLTQGFIIVKTKIYPMIGTLASLTILQGAAYLASKGHPITGTPESTRFLAQGYVGPIPFPVILLAIVVAVASFVLNKTYIGRSLYLVGSNTEAARLSGINTQRIQIVAYGICGGLCGFAGIIMMSRISSGSPTVAVGLEMDCLTAVVIGGVSLMGGEGKLSKALAGILLMGVLINALTILNIDEYNQKVIKGVVFLLAVCYDGIQKQVDERRKQKVTGGDTLPEVREA